MNDDLLSLPLQVNPSPTLEELIERAYKSGLLDEITAFKASRMLIPERRLCFTHDLLDQAFNRISALEDLVAKARVIIEESIDQKIYSEDIPQELGGRKYEVSQN